jgi:hypothetical protein
MSRGRLVTSVVAGVCAVALSVLLAAGSQRVDISAIPPRLSDRQFWQLSTSLSEPPGTFRSENLVSNEHTFQYVIPALQRLVKPGGVYLGVAPDQNFTYILATAPRMAFIVDVRRGNLLQHLMYKALIELSADRVAFVSRLFSKPAPAGLTPAASAIDLFTAYEKVQTSESLYRQNLRAITDHLVKRHGFPLSPDDLAQIENIYFAFFWDGPSIRYSTTSGFGSRGRLSSFPTYEELMMQTDWEGRPRSYLATEENFRTIKAMQEKNLIVPVVGNFAGQKALRGVGDYIRTRGATVSAFYVSNVEQYLYQEGFFEAFARNVATLPIDHTSTFIRSVSNRFGYQGPYLGPDGRASALYPIQTFLEDFEAGRLRTYYDLNSRSK